MKKNWPVPASLLCLTLLGACVASVPRMAQVQPPFTIVSFEIWGSDTIQVGAVLADKKGRRHGWEAGAVIQGLPWDCAYEFAEPGIPDYFPPADDTTGSFTSPAWDEPAATVAPAAEPPPTYNHFIIQSHPKATGLLAAAECELWVTPFQTGAVTFNASARRGSKQCNASGFTVALQSGFRYRYRAEWKPVGDSCSVRITPAGREKVAAGSAE